MTPADATSRLWSQRNTLASLAFLGFVSALWALFQWGELLVARAGGDPFCSISATFDCKSVWDSGIAVAIHDITRVPVAGWGLVWGVVAFTLALLALRAPEGLSEQGFAAALRLTAIGGAASVVGLAIASAVAGAVCLGCIGTYVVVLSWSALAWFGTREPGFVNAPRGLAWAGGLAVVGYLVLLVPGMRTPHALAAVSKNAIEAAQKAGAAGAPAATPTAANTAPGPFDGPGTGDASRDQQLQALVDQLPPEAKQIMADYLGAYEKEPVQVMPTARVVIGTQNAPVRLVDWTDPLCPHCAELHSVLAQLRDELPPGTFSLEPHHFPLDSQCNPQVQRKRDTDVVCKAVFAQLCLEQDSEKFALAQKLIFENQAHLTSDAVPQVLRPLTEWSAIEACMKLPETRKRLDDDIKAADTLGLEGTPLLFLNGKKLPPLPPLVYALILTHGATKHAAFKGLPAPRPIPEHDAH